MSKKDEILQKIRTAIETVSPDPEIYLFGSQARKSADKGSDWDILVLLDTREISFEFENKIIDAIYEVEIVTGEIITPLIYTTKEWKEKYTITPLYESISQEGIRI
jgi:predicted nucleotidyltransferase